MKAMRLTWSYVAVTTLSVWMSCATHDSEDNALDSEGDDTAKSPDDEDDAGEGGGASLGGGHGHAGHGQSSDSGDGDESATGGDSADTGSSPPPDCYEHPRTHLEIINACTDATKIEKSPALTGLNSDGSLPPLP